MPQRSDQAPNPISERATFTPWTWETLDPELNQVNQGRSFTQGKQAYKAAQCSACHRFRDERGAVGPNLTTIGSRFTPKDVLSREEVLDLPAYLNADGNRQDPDFSK